MKLKLKKHIHAHTFCFLFCFFFIPQSHAYWLSELLKYDASQSTFWQKRVENVNEIEDNLYRDLNFTVACLSDPEHENLWANFLSYPDSIESLNRVILNSTPPQNLSPTERNLLSDSDT